MKRLLLVVTALFVLVLGGISCAPSAPPETPAPIQPAPPPPEPSPPVSPPEEITPPSILTTLAVVVRVIDGDTIEVDIEGKLYKVRYIGVDTPETVHPTRGEEPYGKEACAKNKELVEGKIVVLEKDVSGTDKYGRLLRYVYVDDLFVNAELVRVGYAQVSTYPPDVKYQDLFLQLQREAREAGRGLWASEEKPEITTTEVYTLDVSVSPPGSGSVTPARGDFSAGARVILTAIPASGYNFSQWGGDASGTLPTATITMNSDKCVTAYFEKIPVIFNLTIIIVGQGTTNPSSGIYLCDEYTPVNITATAAAGWEFDRWNGDASGTSPTVTISMDSDKTVIAYFKQLTAVGSSVQITRIFYDGLVPRVESDEYVEITNLGDKLQDLAGWVLKDISEGYPSFAFPHYILKPGATIRVYTNEVHPEWGGFSFGYGKAIWNNKDPDTAALYDAQGQEVSRKSY